MSETDEPPFPPLDEDDETQDLPAPAVPLPARNVEADELAAPAVPLSAGDVGVVDAKEPPAPSAAFLAEDAETAEFPAFPRPAAASVTGRAASAPSAPRGRPDLVDRREPLYRDCRGYRLRLDPPDLARLRELPGSRGKSDEEIGEAFFDGQAERFAASLAEDVPAPSEIRVVVDPYSRQAFLALENRIRGVLSF